MRNENQRDADDSRWVWRTGSKSVGSSHKYVTCGERVCVCVCVKAAHTHTRRGGDGVRTGDVRLSMVQADENFHGPAKEKEKKEKSTTAPPRQHRRDGHADSGLVAPQGWLFNPELHTGVKKETSTPVDGF